MPLLDHHHWESFHSNWATRLADALNGRWLPNEFMAEEHTHAGSLTEIDVATFERPAPSGGATVLTRPAWTAPAPDATAPLALADGFEVRVFSTTAGLTLVGVIELVSPGNKDRPEERHAFATKCASYVYQGVSVVIVDIVTSRKTNLHCEVVDLLRIPQGRPNDEHLYAAAYRAVQRQDRTEVDLWTMPCALGEPLPTMPLYLRGDLAVPIEFEATYQEACRRRRMA